MEDTLRVIDIIAGTTVDGPGLRTSIYFAGCHHQCPGCHNPQSWDMNAGKPMTIDEIIQCIDEEDFNVTFSGGDPLYQIDPLLKLAEEIRKSGRTIWCYTGFTLEEIASNPKLTPILDKIDVLVDGTFVESLRDTALRFRGSSNQRIIDTHSLQDLSSQY